jgi:hypothetical protein
VEGGNGPSGTLKCGSFVTEELSASQEGLCCMELVNVMVMMPFYVLFISENLLKPIKLANGSSTVNYLFIYLFPVYLRAL